MHAEEHFQHTARQVTARPYPSPPACAEPEGWLKVRPEGQLFLEHMHSPGHLHVPLDSEEYFGVSPASMDLSFPNFTF